MNFQIENNFLSVKIHQKGAELASIIKKSTGVEYIWEGDPTYWGRHSAILFPIIGEVLNGRITVDGQSYSLKRHGFLRDAQFELEVHTDNQVILKVSSSPETRSLYPYSFEFKAIYTLIGQTLSVTYQVVNPSDSVLIFSVGGHPGFNCPLLEGEKRSDYALVFNEKEKAHTQLLNDKGLRIPERQLVMDDSNVITLTDHLFDHDALIFHELNSSEVRLVNQTKGIEVLAFDFSGFPYLGIWSKNQASPFVCIEPWVGVADPEEGFAAFTDKEGVVHLLGHQAFNCTHKIQIF